MRIVESEIRIIWQKNRMPFRYGVATMTEFPLLFLRIGLEANGTKEDGFASDILPPKWFRKVPEKDPKDEIEEMLSVISRAAETSVGMKADSVFELWQALYLDQDRWGKEKKLPPLLSHFGTSLVERAIIEAFSRICKSPFSQLVLKNEMGINLGKVHHELAESEVGNWLPKMPLKRITARHTIGLTDPLTHDECEKNRISDSLPQALSECIDRYELKHFKLKISGDAKNDLLRLSKIIDVVNQHSKGDVKFSLDGNEQFRSIAAFDEFWSLISQEAWFESFRKNLLFVEQPFHRDLALSPLASALKASSPSRPPILIDESDGDLEALPRALELGYQGTSHKNCKGIFKGIANRCLIEKRRRQDRRCAFFMSGEDLCNQGLSLLQDLSVMAFLGIDSVERNGHHYSKGLSGLSTQVQEKFLTCHPDLFEKSEFGWATLRIRGGELDLKSINAAPLGCAFKMPLKGLPTLSEWKRQTTFH